MRCQHRLACSTIYIDIFNTHNSHTWNTNELSKKPTQYTAKACIYLRYLTNTSALLAFYSQQRKFIRYRVGGLVGNIKYFSANFGIRHFDVSIYESACIFAGTY